MLWGLLCCYCRSLNQSDGLEMFGYMPNHLSAILETFSFATTTGEVKYRTKGKKCSSEYLMRTWRAHEGQMSFSINPRNVLEGFPYAVVL
jgi:hypothetical protein